MLYLFFEDYVKYRERQRKSRCETKVNPDLKIQVQQNESAFLVHEFWHTTTKKEDLSDSSIHSAMRVRVHSLQKMDKINICIRVNTTYFICLYGYIHKIDIHRMKIFCLEKCRHVNIDCN